MIDDYDFDFDDEKSQKENKNASQPSRHDVYQPILNNRTSP